MVTPSLPKDNAFKWKPFKVGHNQTMIANILTVHKSTISRELRRNRGLRGYRPKQAHAKAMQRRHEKLKTHIPLTTWAVVNTLIEQDWSPEQISGRLYEEQGVSIHAKPVRQSIVEGMIPYQNQIQTITYEKGLEFSKHQNIA